MHCKRIVTIHSFTEIAEHLPKRPLLLFDIDNTVIEPAQFIGSQEWFDRFASACADHGTAVRAFNNVMKISRVRPMSPSTVPVFQTLAMNHDIMFLSYRDEELRQATKRQLRDIGIWSDHAIVLTGGEKKSKHFKLVDVDLSKYDAVVLIDDNVKHIYDMFWALDCNFIGMYYRHKKLLDS